MEAGESTTLLYAEPCESPIPIEDLVKARNCFFMWTFVSYLCWGILVELYTELFGDVIDANSIGDAAMFSTVAWSMYSLTGFVFTPILATLSDSIGRKPVLLYCAIVVGITGIAAGLFPSNWFFISMLCLQGTGAGTVAIGYALLADYEALIPENWTGYTEDDILLLVDGRAGIICFTLFF